MSEVDIEAALAAAKARADKVERERAEREARYRREATSAARALGVTVAPDEWSPHSSYPDGRDLIVALGFGTAKPIQAEWFASWDQPCLMLIIDPSHTTAIHSQADLGDFIRRRYPGLTGIAEAPKPTVGEMVRTVPIPAFEAIVAQARAELEAIDRARGIEPDQWTPPPDPPRTGRTTALPSVGELAALAALIAAVIVVAAVLVALL
jgi:hypothetical protein